MSLAVPDRVEIDPFDDGRRVEGDVIEAVLGNGPLPKCIQYRVDVGEAVFRVNAADATPV